MTSKEEHRKNIQRMLIDSKRQLNDAADRGNIADMHRLTDQVTSLSRLLEAAS